jgi:hypothetical protein
VAEEKATKRVELTRAIILDRQHAEAGSVHDVPRALANRLIGEGSAIQHLEEGQEPETAPTTVNRMEQSTNRDPESKQVAPAPPKVKGAR